MNTNDEVKAVDDLKAKGNNEYQKGELEDAIESYTQALEALEVMEKKRVESGGSAGSDDHDHDSINSLTMLHITILSNRAQCYLKQQPLTTLLSSSSNNLTKVWMRLCIQDCTDALDLLDGGSSTLDSKSNVREKLLFRRAKARLMKCSTSSIAEGVRPEHYTPEMEEEDMTNLNDAAKDLLKLLSDNPHNKDAQNLLQRIKMKHGMLKDQSNSGSSIVGRLLQKVKQAWEASDLEDDAATMKTDKKKASMTTPMDNAQEYASKLHEHLSKLLSYLSSDECTPNQDWMEFGRRGGVPLLWNIVQGTKQIPVAVGEPSSGENVVRPTTVYEKVPMIALHILSCVTSLPSVAQQYANKMYLSQVEVSKLVVEACSCQEDVPSSLAVSTISLLLRLVVALDEKGPDLEEDEEKDNSGTKKKKQQKSTISTVDSNAICEACVAALCCPTSVLPAKAALDLLTAWTSPDREMVAQALWESSTHGHRSSNISLSAIKKTGKKGEALPSYYHKKLTKMEEHKLKPKEFASYRRYQYQMLKYHMGRAKCHSIHFLTKSFPTNATGEAMTGMEALLRCAGASNDVRHVRELSVVMGRLLSHIQEGSQYDDEDEIDNGKRDVTTEKAGSKEKEDAKSKGTRRVKYEEDQVKKDEFDELKKIVATYLKISKSDDDAAQGEERRMGPLIEELDEEEASTYEDEKDDGEQNKEQSNVLSELEGYIKQGLLIVSLFVANLSDVGVWAMEQTWRGCNGGGSGGKNSSSATYSTSMNGLMVLEALAAPSLLSSLSSSSICLRAQRVASEWMASCTTSEKGRTLLAPLLQRNEGSLVWMLMESEDADVRSGAATALAKLGMASASSGSAGVGGATVDAEEEEGELMSMLQLAADLLQQPEEEDDGEDTEQKRQVQSGATSSSNVKGPLRLHDHPLLKQKGTNNNSEEEVPSTTVERGVEVLSFLCSRTKIKEEVAHGYKCERSSSSKSKKHQQTVVERLVELAVREGAAETRYAYGIACIFANLCVSVETLRKEAFEGKDITLEEYDQLQSLGKTDEEKELLKQQKTHENDTDVAVMDRIRKLANANVPRALVNLLRSDGTQKTSTNTSSTNSTDTKPSSATKSSDATQEQLTLAMCRMATEPSVRGTMIQQGCLSACLKLDKDAETSTDVQKQIVQHVRHTVAKMLVTTNPGILTSAQRMNSIKPLMSLIRDSNSKDLQKFEALLSITNLASCGDEERNRIVSQKGISILNYAMFSDHNMVRRAATEAMSNLFPHEALLKHLEDPEHMKLWVAFASDYEENLECARAAAGCLAMATQSPQLGSALIKVSKFKDTIKLLLECGQLEMMHRCMVMLLNLMELQGECREAVMETSAVAFCKGYLDTFNNQTAQDMGITQAGDQEALAATLDMAKAIVRASS